SVLDLPVVYASARAGRASLSQPADGDQPDSDNLDPLFDVLLEHVPAPTGDPDAPLQALVTNLDASSFLGRIALCRLHAGRLRKGRLDAELIGNVSVRVLPADRPDTWEVQGRGELALAVLVETMRREGFELTVGKPQVVTRTIDGTLCEPFEHLTIDAPEEH